VIDKEHHTSLVFSAPLLTALQALTSLDISGITHNHHFDWSVLGSSNIYLRKIVTGEPTDSLLLYLKGYQGLQDLKFAIPRQSEQIIQYIGHSQELFTTVLPAHWETLRSFDSIPTAHFDPKWLPHLLRLSKLEYLAFTVVLFNQPNQEQNQVAGTICVSTVQLRHTPC
jgi:hypothetical protein